MKKYCVIRRVHITKFWFSLTCF